MSSTDMVDSFEIMTKHMVDSYFPEKMVTVGPRDLLELLRTAEKLIKKQATSL